MLIKVIAQAVPAYAMSVFLISQSLCDNIEKLSQDFGEVLPEQKETYTGQGGKGCPRLR